MLISSISSNDDFGFEVIQSLLIATLNEHIYKCLVHTLFMFRNVYMFHTTFGAHFLVTFRKV